MSSFADEVLLNMEKGHICSAVFWTSLRHLTWWIMGSWCPSCHQLESLPVLWSGLHCIWVIGNSELLVRMNYTYLKLYPLLSVFHKEASWVRCCSLYILTICLLLTTLCHGSLLIKDYYFNAPTSRPPQVKVYSTAIKTSVTAIE